MMKLIFSLLLLVFTLPSEALTTWTQCATEGNTCAFTGNPRVVKYGTPLQYRTRTVTLSIACTAAQFGNRDPALGQAKQCWYAGAAGTPPPSGEIPGAPTLTPSGPVYTTPQTITTPGTVIDGARFSATSGNCLYITAANVTVRNSVFQGCPNHAIAVEGTHSATITHNTFIGVGKAILFQGRTVHSSSATYNYCKNSTAADKNVSCVKLNGVGYDEDIPTFGAAGMVVSNNTAQQDAGVGNSEDIFSFHTTKGTAVSPVMIENNCVDGANNVSSTGTAFNIGDGFSGWLHARNNTVVNVHGSSFAHSGAMGVNGGNDITVENHKVYCRNVNTSANQHCQMATWNYYGQTGQPGATCLRITITGAQSDVRNAAGTQVNGYEVLGAPNWTCSTTMTNNNFLANLQQPVCPHTN